MAISIFASDFTKLSTICIIAWKQESPDHLKCGESSLIETMASSEELESLQAQLPPLEPDADTTAIGRWGEELVSRHLRASGETLQWMNEHAESGLPYDIRIQREGATDPIYLEVKTTVSTSRHVFPISGQEIAFAREQQSSYWVVRVYACGKDAASDSTSGHNDDAIKMLKLEDPL